MDAWVNRAVCSGAGPRKFYTASHEAYAKMLCGRCPVRQECLDYALESLEPDGVWGGLNTDERRRYLRRGVPTEVFTELELVTYTTRARSTGATCSAGRTAAGWGVVCVTHSTSASTENRTAAEYAVSRPQEWCPGCAAL